MTKLKLLAVTFLSFFILGQAPSNLTFRDHPLGTCLDFPAPGKAYDCFNNDFVQDLQAWVKSFTKWWSPHINVEDYGASPSASAAVNTAAFTSADAVGKSLLIPPGTFALNNITLNSPIIFTGGSVLDLESGQTVTLNGSITAPRKQIFQGNGLVVFNSGAADKILPEWWGIDGTADEVEINKAIAAAQGVTPVVLRYGHNYSTSDEITSQGLKCLLLRVDAKGTPNASYGTVIQYNGSQDDTKAVLRTTDIQGSVIEGMILDANGLAGYSMVAEGLATAWNQNQTNNVRFKDWRLSGLYFNGTYQASDSEFNGCQWYQGQVAGTYGVHAGTGSNISTMTFNKPFMDANPSFQYKNNVFLDSGGSGFNFYNAVFAQTVAISGTDGYAIYSTGPHFNLVNVWNEASGLVYQGSNNTNPSVSQWTGVHDQTKSYFSPRYKHLAIFGGYFNDDIELSGFANKTNVFSDGTKFASGKGWVDVNGARAFGDAGTEFIYASYPTASGAVILHYIANTHFLTLTGNITSINPATSRQGFPLVVHLTQDGTGSRLVTWGGDFTFPGGSAPTLTTTPGAVDIFRFVFDGTTYVEVSRSLDVK